MPQGRDEAGNLWEYDGLDANGEPINPRPVRAQSPRGTVYTPPPAPKAPPTPDLPTGWEIGPDGVARPVKGIPSEIYNPKGAKAEGSIPDVTAKIRADALGQFNGARMLNQAQSTMVDAFKKGPGSTSGPFGVADFLPEFLSESNQNFNKDAEAGRGMVVQGLGLTGGSVNSMPEAQMWTGPYTPKASDWDSTTRQGIDRLAPLRESAARKSISVLGGVPDLDGTLHPIGSQRANQILADMGLTPDLRAIPKAWDQEQANGVAADGSSAPLLGGMEGGTIENLPGPIDGGISGMGYRGAPVAPASGALLGPQFREENDWEAQGRLEAMFRGGASFEQMQAEGEKYGTIITREGYDKGRAWLKKYPNEKSNLVAPPRKRVEQSAFERGVQGAPGAAGIGLANAGSMGALEAIAPEGVGMSREAHPYASMAGEIGGVIGNQAGAMRFTPLGRIQNAVARNLAYDTAYSGARGAAADPENPLRGAITTAPLGMAGSLGGQAVASGVGRGLSGVRSSPSVQWLRDRGVTPTLGQIMRGRASDNGARSFVAGIEDSISNTPGAGAMVNTARNRTVADANTAIYRDVGGPNINGVAEEALTGLQAAKTNAFNDALRGVNIPKNDPRMVAQMNAVNPGRPAAVDEFGGFLDGKLRPIMDDGRPSISGARLQEAMRLLGKEGRTYGKAASGTPYYSDVADAIKQTENALVGAAARNAPQAIPKLKAANALNRNLSILDDAAERAAGNPGASSGVWSAAQLKQAMLANNTKFGKRGLLGFGKSPLAEGQRAMQAVIPNEVPPTGVNVAPIMAGLGAAAGGANETTGLDSNIVRALATVAMLSAPYTRTGAKLTAKALLDRPQSVAKFGSAIRKQKGLFGSATLPFLLEANK